MVGGGPAGLTAAIALAEAGVATVLVGKRAGAAGQPHHRPAGRFRHRAGRRSASGTLARRRPRRSGSCASSTTPAGCGARRRLNSTRRKSASTPSATTSRTAIWSPRSSGAPRALSDAAHHRRRSRASCRKPTPTSHGHAERAATAACARLSSAPTAADRSAAMPPASRVDERRYPQVALTVCLRHSRPHHDTSTEFHTPTGPFTLGAAAGPPLEPGLGARSRPRRRTRRTRRRRALRRDRTRLAFDPRQDRGRAGPRPVSAPRRHRADASPPSASRSVGEAAHVIPPIGAQGLNLGLRDAATIGELAVARASPQARYRRRRRDGRLRPDAPHRRRQPHARHRSAQPHAAHRFPAGAERARAWPLS